MKQKVLEFLISNGMWGSHAEEVFDLIKEHYLFGDMNSRWEDDAEGYLCLFAVLSLTIRDIALEWIDENNPMAWYRPMFCADTKAELARLRAEKKHD